MVAKWKMFNENVKLLGYELRSIDTICSWTTDINLADMIRFSHLNFDNLIYFVTCQKHLGHVVSMKNKLVRFYKCQVLLNSC